MKIAVIGAGFSGLVLARELSDIAEVHVFEKARGVGGRMSTRYADPFYFDHGAQCFTARTDAFKNYLKPFEESGLVTEWKGKVINFELGKKVTKRMWFEPHLVASPNMNSLCKMLAENLAITLNTEIAPLTDKTGSLWELHDIKGNAVGAFDMVISTAPPAQTQRLFGSHLTKENPLSNASLVGCYALMIGFNKPWDKQWIAAKIRNNPLKWVSVNSSKPGRNKDVTCLVVHSRNNWAEEHIDDDMEEAQAFLVSQFEAVTGISCTGADYLSIHRWRYAIIEKTEKIPPFYDATNCLAATSDWCSTSRIEEVWLNAMALCEQIRLKH